MEKSEKIAFFTTFILIGLSVSVAFCYYSSDYTNFSYIDSSFLSPIVIAFNDFTSCLQKIAGLNPYSPPGDIQSYFPLAFILIYPFTFIKNAIVAYFVFLYIFLAFFIKFNIDNFKCVNLTKIQNFQNVFVMTFLSYPFLYLVDRGNLDMMIFIFLVGFTFLFKSEKYKLSAVCLSIANAMKPFSLIFLILLLSKKKYKEFLLSVSLTLILIFGGFLFFKGSISSQFNILLQSWRFMSDIYMYNVDKNYGYIGSSSLFMFLKLIFCRIGLIPFISLHLFVKIYSFFGILFALFVSFFICKQEILWKKFALATLYMTLIPPLVFDYKLIFLFIPIGLFVNEESKSRFDLIYTILFSILLIPKYFIVKEDIWGVPGRLFSISLIINAMTMLFFIFLIIYEQLRIKNGAKSGKI